MKRNDSETMMESRVQNTRFGYVEESEESSDGDESESLEGRTDTPKATPGTSICPRAGMQHA